MKEKRGEGITPCLPFHYLILFIQSLTRKIHFLDKIRRIFLIKWTGWGIHWDKLLWQCYYIVYTLTVYRRILKFFKQAKNSRIWILLFFKWFLLWVCQFFMSLNIRHRNFVIALCEFFLSLLVRNAVCSLLYMYVPPIRADTRSIRTRMNPDVEFTVFRIVFYEILIMLGIKFITKVYPKVGLRTFCTIHFSPLTICRPTANCKL